MPGVNYNPGGPGGANYNYHGGQGSGGFNPGNLSHNLDSGAANFIPAVPGGYIQSPHGV